MQSLKTKILQIKLLKIVKKYEDDYGEIWHEVEGEFTIASKNISKDPEALRLNAKKDI